MTTMTWLASQPTICVNCVKYLLLAARKNTLDVVKGTICQIIIISKKSHILESNWGWYSDFNWGHNLCLSSKTNHKIWMNGVLQSYIALSREQEPLERCRVKGTKVWWHLSEWIWQVGFSDFQPQSSSRNIWVLLFSVVDVGFLSGRFFLQFTMFVCLSATHPPLRSKVTMLAPLGRLIVSSVQQFVGINNNKLSTGRLRRKATHRHVPLNLPLKCLDVAHLDLVVP